MVTRQLQGEDCANCAMPFFWHSAAQGRTTENANSLKK
jgi:hypothetical protein